MKIAIAYQNAQVADASTCTEYLIITAQNGQPAGKELVAAPASGAASVLTLFGRMQIDVFICGALGIAMRNALEMLGIVLVPGVEGAAEEAAAKFLTGEKQGDPTVLDLCREEDPNDPMACMHDCSRCGGCGPVHVPEGTTERLPPI